MNRVTITLGALALAGIALGPPARALEVAKTDQASLNLNGRLQMLGVVQDVPDAVRNDDRIYLFMKQSRLKFSGDAAGARYALQWAYGGEDLVATGTGIALTLLDYTVDLPLGGGHWVKLGQFKVPYGRERLTDSGTLDFAERSVQNLGFAWNRDVGAAFYGRHGIAAGTVAVMTGGGRDVPQRYLPEVLGTPMTVARLGIDTGVDEDAFTVSAGMPDPAKGGIALYANGLFLKDTLIGHSTVLNVRLTDKSLLVNPNYNPYIGKAPYRRGTIRQAGGDLVIRQPLGPVGIVLEAEANYADFRNLYGRIALRGGRVQAGVVTRTLEVNLRYAQLGLDPSMGYTYAAGKVTALPAKGAPVQEVTPSLTWHARSHVTVIADAPMLLDALVYQEKGLGSYVGSEQPDQISYTAPGKGSAIRTFVPEARLLVQVAF